MRFYIFSMTISFRHVLMILKGKGIKVKRTAIYMRVSTDRQAQEGESIPAQRTALRQYIDNHSDMIFAGEYLDDGVSGTRDDRDEL